MARKPFLLASTVSLMASLAIVSSSHGQLSSTGSRVVRACGTPVDCLPDSTSVVLLYLYDITGVAIADMPVSAINGVAATRTARTDRQGMAALSVTRGLPYRIRVDAPGWIPLTMEEKIPAKGGVDVLRIEMRVPPIHN